MMNDFSDFIDSGSDSEEKSDGEEEIAAPAKGKKCQLLDKLDAIFWRVIVSIFLSAAEKNKTMFVVYYLLKPKRLSWCGSFHCQVVLELEVAVRMMT